MELKYLTCPHEADQKIHTQDVILVSNLSLMWADQLKKLTAVPSIYKEVNVIYI
jgi:hypothetical protein